eukprot:g70234.t1
MVAFATPYDLPVDTLLFLGACGVVSLYIPARLFLTATEPRRRLNMLRLQRKLRAEQALYEGYDDVNDVY